MVLKRVITGRTERREECYEMMAKENTDGEGWGQFAPKSFSFSFSMAF